ncbi:hypothetical protein ABID23_000671 [Bartonella silvatica]|uniref:Uncharacterized protein n=1 Tax=Bartonella silvatica TaxID=357760 RepID=A0ABV2HGA9_9HYPH
MKVIQILYPSRQQNNKNTVKRLKQPTTPAQVTISLQRTILMPLRRSYFLKKYARGDFLHKAFITLLLPPLPDKERTHVRAELSV